MCRVGSAEDRRERLHRRTHHVVVRLLGGQRDAGGLGVEAQPLGLLGPCAVDVPQPAGPDAACRAELGDLLEEIDVRVEEEGEARREDVDVQAAAQAQFDVAEAVGQGVREFLRGRRARLADVVAGDGERLVRRDGRRAVLHQVADQAEVRLRAEEPLLLRDVLLEDVRLERAVEGGRVDALALGGDDVHAEDGDGRSADRHGRGDVAQRDVPEQGLHVGGRVDGDPAVPDLAEGAGIVGVAAHQRGHVERHREAPAAVGQNQLVALVGLPRVAEPGELADRPGAAPVAGRIQAAREGILARPADPLEALVPVAGAGAVDRLHGIPGERREVRLTLERGVVPGLPAATALLDGVRVHAFKLTRAS